jgi:hypothetical protein
MKLGKMVCNSPGLVHREQTWLFKNLSMQMAVATIAQRLAFTNVFQLRGHFQHSAHNAN